MNAYRSLNSIQHAIKAKEISCLGLTQSYIKNIDSNKNLNAFVEVFTDEAIQRAKQIDKKIRNGTAGKLAGMVIGIKDNSVFYNHTNFK